MSSFCQPDPCSPVPPVIPTPPAPKCGNLTGSGNVGSGATPESGGGSDGAGQNKSLVMILAAAGALGLGALAYFLLAGDSKETSVDKAPEADAGQKKKSILFSHLFLTCNIIY